MANKRINELALRTPQTTDLMLIGDPTTGYSYKTTLLSALNLGVPTTRTITINGTTFDLSANRTWSVGTVTSVGLTMPSAFNVASSPVTGSGTIAVTAAGLASQYIRGDGTLADFPGGGGGGGASVSYYLNGSVNQGTIGGVTYYEMNKTPILGAGTNFTTSSNGYIASFLTDAGDPALLKIPGGNWNTEFYFAASSGGGTPTYYLELYKYDGTTFTLIASSSSNPDTITGGTSVEQYFTTIAVPETILTATDRLAIRIYVTTAGRTITLHTENSNLCQIITTFTTGLTALNGLTAQVQYFATGSAGTDFNISSSTATHTFNIPTASSVNRGLLSTADWTTFNNKVSSIIAGNAITVSNASGNVTVNHADTSGADPGATITGSNVFRSIVLDTYGHVTGLSYSSFLISDLGGTAISSPSNGQVLSYNGTNWVNSSLSGLSIITGSGTTNWVPKFTSASAIGLSNIYDGGSFIGVFTDTDNLSGAKLQVSGAATFSGNLFIGATSGSNTAGFTNRLYLEGNLPSLTLSNTGTNTGKFTFGVTNGNLGIWNNATSTYPLFINSSNNVGIGTTSPSYKLDVTGTGRFTSDLIVTGGSNIIAGNGSALENLVIINGQTYSGLRFQRNSVTKWAIFNNSAGTDFIDFYNYTTNTSQLVLTSTGNLGLGVVPSAWKSGWTAFQNSYSSFVSDGARLAIGYNWFLNSSSSDRYITNDYATLYQQVLGQHIWYTAPSGTAGNAITFTQAMTLTSAGRLLLGTATESTYILDAVGDGRFSGSVTATGGLISNGGSIGYGGGELGFGVTTSGATSGIYTLATGSPILYFDHRATGNTGFWVWRNGTGAGSERMRITSGGNVGIAENNPSSRLHILATNTSNNFTGVNYPSETSGILLDNQQSTTNVGAFTALTFRVYNAVSNQSASILAVTTASGTSPDLVFTQRTAANTNTERMRITSGGLVGIGTASIPSDHILQVHNPTTYARMALTNSSTGVASGDGLIFQMEGTTAIIKNQENDALKLGANGSETQLVLTSGGNVGIGTASPNARLEVSGSGTDSFAISINAANSTANGMTMYLPGNRSSDTTYRAITVGDDSAVRFRVFGNGNVQNTNGSYGTISDISIKENIIDATAKLADILKLKVRNFNLIGEANKQIGFIAQELEQVFPGLIDIDGETKLKSVKTSVLIPILVKAIQELKTELDTLKN